MFVKIGDWSLETKIFIMSNSDEDIAFTVKINKHKDIWKKVLGSNHIFLFFFFFFFK